MTIRDVLANVFPRFASATDVVATSFDWLTGLSVCCVISRVITLVLVIRRSIENCFIYNEIPKEKHVSTVTIFVTHTSLWGKVVGPAFNAF